MSERIRKVNELIKHEVADALKREGVSAFVTVKAVETSRDMKHADVWVSVIGEDEEEIMQEIEEKRREVQQAVSVKLTSRNVPVITFRMDRSGAYAQKIEELLKNGNTKS
jgi:ribosome-binding factor A